jgi:AraC-like DNA-binding protein
MISDVALRRPSPGLAPYVERYIGYRFEGFPAGIHRGLPSRHLTFIVSLGRPVEMVQDADAAPTPIRMGSFVGGLQTWPAQIRHDGNEHGIAIELTPLGAPAVLGVPAGELAGQVIDLGDLLVARSRELIERLHEAEGWRARFTVLDEILLRGLSERFAPSGTVVHAWDRLVRGAGGLDVASLAADVGWSRRHLTEQIRREVGLPPRQVNRVLRFERSRALLHRSGYRTLTEVAAEAGYFDHAHMVHEWQRLAGCTPSDWLREELPSVQDGLELVD